MAGPSPAGVRTVNAQGHSHAYEGLDHFGYGSLEEFLDHTAQVWNPDKVTFWTETGTPLVIGKRQGYFLYDTAGRRYFDLHLNGGTYNLGHRNPEIVRRLQRAADFLDIGYAVVFLAGTEASFVTGQALIVDGGQVLPESLVSEP